LLVGRGLDFVLVFVELCLPLGRDLSLGLNLGLSLGPRGLQGFFSVGDQFAVLRLHHLIVLIEHLSLGGRQMHQHAILDFCAKRAFDHVPGGTFQITKCKAQKLASRVGVMGQVFRLLVRGKSFSQGVQLGEGLFEFMVVEQEPSTKRARGQVVRIGLKDVRGAFDSFSMLPSLNQAQQECVSRTPVCMRTGLELGESSVSVARRPFSFSVGSLDRVEYRVDLCAWRFVAPRLSGQPQGQNRGEA
jgi:hypothetical protein